ncbi:uncharacterized protein LOC122850501 [Aphidius gifuensis]|uniref:uncharacterized protein LOC122850501 n=1 Tax=Aphidius gifuensis TaxID=684658 RepID=UPI001CDBE4AF|nr:uncharacterized protein LOC122850501 [Aphidius gifuensis]
MNQNTGVFFSPPGGRGRGRGLVIPKTLKDKRRISFPHNIQSSEVATADLQSQLSSLSSPLSETSNTPNTSITSTLLPEKTMINHHNDDDDDYYYEYETLEEENNSIIANDNGNAQRPSPEPIPVNVAQQILNELHDMEQRSIASISNLTKVVQTAIQNHQDIDQVSPELPDRMPFVNIEDFNHFENSDRITKKKLTKYLASMGGFSSCPEDNCAILEKMFR